MAWAIVASVLLTEAIAHRRAIMDLRQVSCPCGASCVSTSGYCGLCEAEMNSVIDKRRQQEECEPEAA
jgi:hypothetical protein